MGLIGSQSCFIFVGLLFVLGLANSVFSTDDEPVDDKPCDSDIYCYGDLLHAVQEAHVFKDSKTFVDMPMNASASEIKTRFQTLKSTTPNLTTEIMRKFVGENFLKDGEEFKKWDPKDFKDSPAFLKKINDPKLKTWAHAINGLWKELGREIKEDIKLNPNKYSMKYVPNPVIVPGGRFKEFYYWDSYWIQLGLLHSEMTTTVKGMLENFIYMVEELGYVPNGGRIYYRRSQPPFLAIMADNYVKSTKDIEFLKKNLPGLEKEFEFWVKPENGRYVEIEHNGHKYPVCIYNSRKAAPRPESYREDLELAHNLTGKERNEFYYNIHAGAESGWDFSSRWFKTPAKQKDSLSYIKTTEIVPVDLNALMFKNARILADYNKKYGTPEKVAKYENHANNFRAALNELMWDEEEGCWFDWDRKDGGRRIDFYQSNLYPLWVGATPTDNPIKKIVNYLKMSKVLDFQSGVPTSMRHSKEQWDYPNGWAPLQHIMVEALHNSDDPEAKEIAFKIAEKWLIGNFRAYYKDKKRAMYEKYDVTVAGDSGGGGEYEVVEGFGWTNGVVLDFLDRYGDKLKAPLAQVPEGVSGGSALAVMSLLPLVLLALTQVFC